MAVERKIKEANKQAERKVSEKLTNDHKETSANDHNNQNETKKKDKELDEDNSWKKLNNFQKLKHMMSLITVEPILACYVMPSVLSALATQNLYLEKACRVNLGFGDHICDALTRRETTNYTAEEEAVQRLVASVAGWKTVLQSFLPCVVLIFLGAYSDRVGKRKICMLLPIIGEFLTSISLIINTYYFYELPLEVAAVTEAIFPALTGGWFTMFMGVFSYIADVTTEEQRTLRIGVVNLFYSVGVPVGAALSGILVRKIGFYGVFTISGLMYVLSFVYGLLRIKDVKKPDIIVEPTKNCCEFLQKFFDIGYVKETVMVAFKHGPNNRRLRVIMLIVVLCVVIGPIYGEMAVTYLFTRYRFNWNEVDYSVFSTYSVCTSLIGTLFSVCVFSHLLKFNDAIVGVISCMSKIMSSFMYAFAMNTWQIYIGPLIEIFSGTSFIAMRSMVSKLVDRDELGKVNSIFGVAEALMPLVYAPMYTTVYTATIKTLPGAFFLLGGALTVPAVLIFLWLYYVSKKYSKKEGSLENLDEGNIVQSIEKTNKVGVVNKTFEANEGEVKTQRLNNIVANHCCDADNEKNVNQSQIEMGLTKSILRTSKL